MNKNRIYVYKMFVDKTLFLVDIRKNKYFVICLYLTSFLFPECQQKTQPTKEEKITEIIPLFDSMAILNELILHYLTPMPPTLPGTMLVASKWATLPTYEGIKDISNALSKDFYFHNSSFLLAPQLCQLSLSNP